MFELTQEEREFVTRREEVQQQAHMAEEALRRAPFVDSEERRQAYERLHSAARWYAAKLHELEESDTARRIRAKHALRAKLAPELRAMVEVALAEIRAYVGGAREGMSGEVETVQSAVAFVIRGTIGAPAVQQARAEYVAGRRQALLDAGLPDALVDAILVAEAGRPVVLPSFSRGAK